ncbi:hypothetical protein [Magnetospirillum fulvum]|uniref:Sel1 repeat family protein n=1 Tax=Magnetospirillum fulvum TaxID=1082 RepID=A0A1H6GS96_MAGFU|nr:hypothetical protein [Magnetospirillum fulvum]SEH25662.1 hypothetical protein SAMN04244559_00264 [Magnetospirillum fulvum]
MAMIEGICANLPSKCSKAKSREIQRVPDNAAVCAECGFALKRTAHKGPFPGRLVLIAVGAVLALGAIGVGLYHIFKPPQFPACDASGVAAVRNAPPETALALALACRDQGQLDHAVLVLSDLKEKGSGKAALLLGGLYDPLDAGQQTPKHLSPSILNAVEFYQQACTLKEPEAAARLAALRESAIKEAESGGDKLLRDLVDAWPECPL